MLTVSDSFKSAILPGSAGGRQTAARVTINVTEANVTYDGWTATGGEAGFSDVTKVTDGITDNDYRIATCEPDYWKLDGSTIFEPAVTVNVGYASSAISLADGTFASNPAVVLSTTADFVTHGLTLFFDRMSGDYPIEFDIDITYSVGPVDIYNVSVVDNDSAYFVLDDWINADYEQVDTITITFKKMSQGYRRARLTELFLGYQQQYGIGASDDLISVNTTDEIDHTGLTIPSGEAIARISNVNGDFNLIVPVGIAEFLQSGAEMTVEHGVYVNDWSVEYVKTGTYRFVDWRDAGSKTVELNGKDTIGYYGDVPAFAQYDSWTTSSLPQTYIGDILYAANVPSDLVDVSVFPASSSDFLSGVCGDTIRDELRNMAQWACKICVCDADGIIQFVDAESIPTSAISLDDCFDDPTIERGEVIGGVDVNIYTATLGSTVETVGVYTDAITGYQYVKIWVGWDWGYLSATVTGAVSYSDLSFAYGYYVVFVEGNGAAITVTVSGKRYTITTSKYSIDNGVALDARSNRVTVDNPHICRASRAHTVATWILAQYNKNLKLKYDWRGQPALEMGDMSTAETMHGNKDMIVTRQDLAFDGTLSGTIEGVG